MHNQKAQSLAEAVGVITYNMTNDFLFRYILQKNEKVLRGLICALLHLKQKQIRTITITNPINLSENIEGKDFILDINIELNNDTYINLEMQVVNKHNWPDRSLSYLCRNYDTLYQGQDYEEARPVYHIGFLDFTLFPDNPEFYATYKMLNVKNHHTYSDKFVLSVVDLSQIELATEADEACGLTYWARLFKATTWEELKMLANGNEYLEAAAESIFMANSDKMIQQKCRARQEAERYERTVARDMLRLKEENAQLNTNIAKLATDNAQLATDNAQLTDDIVRLNNHIQNMESQMEQMASMIKDLQKQHTKE